MLRRRCWRAARDEEADTAAAGCGWVAVAAEAGAVIPAVLSDDAGCGDGSWSVAGGVPGATVDKGAVSLLSTALGSASACTWLLPAAAAASGADVETLCSATAVPSAWPPSEAAAEVAASRGPCSGSGSTGIHPPVSCAVPLDPAPVPAAPEGGAASSASTCTVVSFAPAVSSSSTASRPSSSRQRPSTPPAAASHTEAGAP